MHKYIAHDFSNSNSWGQKVPGHERGKMLIKLAEAMEANIDELAAIEASDNGKAFAIAKGFDVAEAAACLRYYGGWADKIHGKTIEVNDAKSEPSTFCGESSR